MSHLLTPAVWTESPYSPEIPSLLVLMYVLGLLSLTVFRALPVPSRKPSNKWWVKKVNQGDILCWVDAEGYPHFIVRVYSTAEDEAGVESSRRNFERVVVRFPAWEGEERSV
jgi:hypothetical protein